MEMLKCIKSGLHLAVILIPVTGTRLEISDIKSVRLCLSILGDHSVSHLFIVFTQIERLSPQEQLSRLS